MKKLAAPLVAVVLAFSWGCSHKASGSGAADSKDGKDGKKSAAAAGGLVVDEVKVGEGATATKGKMVSVHYAGV